MSTLSLQPLTMPLHGIRLIEASAGTGKTWTIAALYLRLVLGHGEPAREPLLPSQILVLTFTKAATAELRERIRARLADAALAFRSTTVPDDAFLADLIAAYPGDEARASAARRLEYAGQWMDEAAIHTIHGWCQRMLQQHAFDSGHPFAQDTQADESLLQAEAIRDYWRAHFFPLDRYGAARIRAYWKTPRDLHRTLRPLLSQPVGYLRLDGAALPAIADLGQQIDTTLAPELAALELARRLWREQVDTIDSTLTDILQSGGFKANMMKSDAVASDLLLLRRWGEGSAIDERVLLRYTQTRLISATKKGTKPPVSNAFDAIEAWQAAQAVAPPLKPVILAHAVPWIHRRIDAIKQQRAQIGFDDMLRRLDGALHGPSGERLAHTLVRDFPAALIDEFQDTDPLQWRIFQRIYATRPQQALLLIGDPKQAIYSFRGADIHTYLRARDAALAPTWTLSTNYRSTHGMVRAVNRLFELGDTHESGAFGFGHALPFHPVEAHGRNERLTYEGQPVASLTFALQGGEQAVGIQSYRHAMAEHAAATLVELLDAAQHQRCGFVDAQSVLTPLREGDVAILVRGRTEAALIRDALRRRGLKSVFLSDRDSVFASPQAEDMLRWLQACAEPGSDRAMRVAMATPSMCQRYDELERLNTDERYWESSGDNFRRLHDTWLRHGVLAMAHDLLHLFDLPARLLSLPDGERSLTNILHLAELLQHAAASLDGERALIRYFAARITEAHDAQVDASEEQIVRLESEDALIKVITIHKSKGLEYPYVMLPFAAATRTRSDGDVIVWHAEDGTPIADLAAGDLARAASAREQWQEDLRLLYVALTRARHACWVGIACYRIGNAKAPMLHRSALGYLLSGGEPIEPADLPKRLDHLKHGVADIVVTTLADEADTRVYRAVQTQAATNRHALRYTGSSIEPWRIASYSGLKYAEPATAPTQHAPETATQDVLTEVLSETTLPSSAAQGESIGIHAFHRGAMAGTFLHELFEWAAEKGFAHTRTLGDELVAWIAQRAQRHQWQRHADMLSTWLIQFLDTSLELPTGHTLSLASLNIGQYYAELEFWIGADRVDTQRLDQLVVKHTLGGAYRQPLARETINGMLKGFIDLVFEHQGRYYIVDYKSNQLGPDANAYTHEAMRQSVLNERYDLQYALYTLALHRQLRARLPGYQYQRHMGGTMYLYLRGVDGNGHGIHNECLPYALIDALDRLFQNEGRADAA